MFAPLIDRYERFGIHLGLERIHRLLDLLGDPHLKVPIVHVAGTNGKGSVCAYLSSVLTAAGYRVGRYTSPHLVDWTERICINEQPIAATTLTQLLLDLEAVLAPTQLVPTQFEVLTALAWQYFAQQEVDVAVIEVGLGGRLDATNVCDRPLVSVITSLSLEHWQRLGPTLADIAGEKAGVCKLHCPVVVGPLPPEAAAVVKAKIASLDCPAYWPQPARRIERPAVNIPESSSLPWAEVAGVAFPLSLSGDIQLTNSALAISVLQQLRSQGWAISDDAIIQGMAHTRWPGRLQWVQWHQHPLLIDGAHNPAAALELRRYVDSLQVPAVHWVMGMLATKDHRDILNTLLRPGDALSLSPVPDHSSADVQELAQLATDICPHLTYCQYYPHLDLALQSTLGTHKSPASASPLAVLCGSLYLVGHYLKTYPPTV
ncbi:folylpolyglutamate synthase/dihydrofolate synthase family protein [Acaryochloris sp. IP29b_bin.148]|uniref:bifunctional folylpolyglutamate synthase/dihydrofolate synthase n=1 Tax=Acaryochloris sp. IP29b_bin.148 TaxID=2969218 RepID=UPI00262D987B|nr:folylpolyglutamate synthase/dihydrofolate synthase family protein [Acaryochloris sp. IP29b_bin.148]